MTRIALMALGGVLLAGAARAEPLANVRLLVHGTKQLEESPWGVAGWVIAPNVSLLSDRWIGVVGPRFAAKDSWVEIMGGLVIQQGVQAPVIDVRASSRALAPIVAWTNLQWTAAAEPRPALGYGYLMVDYAVPGGLGLVGLETENYFPDGGEADLGGGPHLVATFGELSLVFAYQFREAADQSWIRMIVNP
jgi:hypothetical protein